MSSNNIFNRKWEIIDDNLDEKLKKLDCTTKDLSIKIDKINSKLESIDDVIDKLNRLYQDLDKKNDIIIEFLKENRNLYVSALNNVTETEKNNYNEIKPYIMNTASNTPVFDSINYNRFLNFSWRNSRLTTTPNIIANLNNESVD